MTRLSHSLERSYSFLSSKKLAVGLFLLLSVSLIPGTFAESNFHASGFSRAIIGCMALNLVLCTLQRITTIRRPVLIMHIGAVATMAGAMVSAFGFVATVNIYEGTSIDRAYRWDRERDESLGFTLAVRKVTTEYYPVPIRVGVLRGQDKIGLFELKTGESFTVDRYLVRADSLEMPSETLVFSIFQGERLIGSTDTDGPAGVIEGFPYEFRLVGYKDPAYKRISVDLAISRDGNILAEGPTEVNSPLQWDGLYFYNTNLERDDYGTPYVGIQIVRDPGKPLVYLGFIILLIGSLLWSYGKLYGKR